MYFIVKLSLLFRRHSQITVFFYGQKLYLKESKLLTQLTEVIVGKTKVGFKSLLARVMLPPAPSDESQNRDAAIVF